MRRSGSHDPRNPGDSAPTSDAAFSSCKSPFCLLLLFLVPPLRQPQDDEDCDHRQPPPGPRIGRRRRSWLRVWIIRQPQPPRHCCGSMSFLSLCVPVLHSSFFLHRHTSFPPKYGEDHDSQPARPCRTQARRPASASCSRTSHAPSSSCHRPSTRARVRRLGKSLAPCGHLPRCRRPRTAYQRCCRSQRRAARVCQQGRPRMRILRWLWSRLRGYRR